MTRLAIGVLIFMGLAAYKGLPERPVLEAMFCLGIFLTFSLMLRNIWLTLFVFWSVILYLMYGMETGVNYITNMFFGCVLYYATKVCYKRQHIDHFIKMMLIFVGVNLAYMVLQILDFDFYYWYIINDAKTGMRTVGNTDPCGFMGFKSGIGILTAMAVPLIATRRFRFALWASLLMAIPIYISRSSICVVGGIAGFLLVSWHRVRRWHWWSAVVILLIVGSLYVWKIDAPMGTLGDRPDMWKKVLRDCTKHPVAGWGLDSFRNFTKIKSINYASSYSRIGNITNITQWDNPHNLPVSLWFEWGILGLILVGGYLRSYFIKFKNAVKSPNALALTGAVLVFFIVSMAQFPIFLGRFAIFIIPIFALAEIEVMDGSAT